MLYGYQVPGIRQVYDTAPGAGTSTGRCDNRGIGTWYSTVHGTPACDTLLARWVPSPPRYLRSFCFLFFLPLQNYWNLYCGRGLLLL